MIVSEELSIPPKEIETVVVKNYKISGINKVTKAIKILLIELLYIKHPVNPLKMSCINNNNKTSAWQRTFSHFFLLPISKLI